MSDGVKVERPRLDDLRPTTTLYAALCAVGLIAVLFSSGYVLVMVKFPDAPRSALSWTTHGLSIACMFGFVHLLGGLRKVCTDWYRRTLMGYELALWQITPHELGMRTKPNYEPLGPIASAPRWVLHVRLGGWGQKPYLRHVSSGWLRGITITNVKWCGDMAEFVTVQDGEDNQITIHPARLLYLLETLVLDGEEDWLNREGIGYLFRLTEERIGRLTEDAKRRSQDMLAERDSRLAAQSQTDTYRELFLRTLSAVIRSVEFIKKSSRLQKSREGAELLRRLEGFLAIHRPHIDAATENRPIDAARLAGQPLESDSHPFAPNVFGDLT